MTKIDYRLFPMRRSRFNSANAEKYNSLIDEIRELAERKFEVPEWDETVEYVNNFAKSGWAEYPKITPNAWKAHLKIEEELEIVLFPALFPYSYPQKDAGTVSWWMYDIHVRSWGSAWRIRDFLKRRYKLVVSDYNNIECEPRKVDEE